MRLNEKDDTRYVSMTKSLYEAPVTYPRTVEKDGYFCTSASTDPFPNWPLEKIFRMKAVKYEKYEDCKDCKC